MASEFATSNDVLRGLIVTAIVFIILDTLFLTLRSFSRFFVKRVEIGWDDALLWPGYALNIGLCALALGTYLSSCVAQPHDRETCMKWYELTCKSTYRHSAYSIYRQPKCG